MLPVGVLGDGLVAEVIVWGFFGALIYVLLWIEYVYKIL